MRGELPGAGQHDKYCVRIPTRECRRTLRRILAEYAMYYQNSRTHLGLAKDTPISRPVSADGSIVAVPHVGGLHHRYDRRAA